MNLQEREQLNLFLKQLTQARVSEKDAEAEMLIREASGRQPDAGYLLVQRAMQLEHALKSVNAQCSELQAELDKLRSGTQSNFLSDPNAWGSSPVVSIASAVTPAGPVVQPIAQGPVGVPAAATPAPSAWGSGILGTVAATTVGVVAGSFLFQGIGNLMGHHNHSGAGGANAGANAASPVTDNGVIENYFADSGEGSKTDLADAGNGFGGDEMT